MNEELKKANESLPAEEKEQLQKYQKKGITKITQSVDQNSGEILSTETTYSSEMKRKKGTFYVGNPEELTRVLSFNKKNKIITIKIIPITIETFLFFFTNFTKSFKYLHPNIFILQDSLYYNFMYFTNHYLHNSAFKISIANDGFACPFVSFMTCPIKNLIARFFPSL